MQLLKQYLDLAIFIILGLMAFIALWCVIERVLFLRKVKFDEYKSISEFEDSISENLTTLYIIYSNAPHRTTWNCYRDNDNIL